MTTPTVKELYEADLLIRFPDHTFDETAVGSLTKVEFKNGSSELVHEATALVDGDAYKNIRENVVGFASDIPLHNNFDSVQTTDATVTTISTIALDDESEYIVDATVMGIESDNSNRGAYKIRGVFYRTGTGNAIQIGSTDLVLTEETAASWTGATFTVSGSNILVQVQGAASTTINWQCIASIDEFEV